MSGQVRVGGCKPAWRGGASRHRCANSPTPVAPRSAAAAPAQGSTRHVAASASSPGATPSGAAGEEARKQLKARLRQLVTKVNSAALPGPADLASLYNTMQQLCEAAPHPDSASSPLINGRWVLLYTASMASLQRAAASQQPAAGSSGGSSSGSGAGSARAGSVGGPFGSSFGGGQAGGAGGGSGALGDAAALLQLANDTAYKFFYDNLPVLAGAAVGARGASSSGPLQARGNFQVFDTAAGRVENQARFDAGGRQCAINVNGSAEVVRPPAGAPCQRLRATFTSFQLVVDGQPRLSLPLSLLNPVGYVDTPYLDAELRISVGDKGSVFIAARDASPTP